MGLVHLSERLGHVVERLYEETLEEDDDDKNNNGREVDSPHRKGEGPAHPVKHGLRGEVEDSDNSIVWVRTHPGDYRPGNYKPHVEGQEQA